jgi:hypothetical protein
LNEGEGRMNVTELYWEGVLGWMEIDGHIDRSSGLAGGLIHSDLREERDGERR